MVSSRVSKLLFSKIHKPFPQLSESSMNNHGFFLRKFESLSEERENPPNPIPNRPLRGEKRRESSTFKLGNDGDGDDGDGYGRMKQQSHHRSSSSSPRLSFESKSIRGGEGRADYRKKGDLLTSKFDLDSNFDDDDDDEKMERSQWNPSMQFRNSSSSRPLRREKEEAQSITSYLEKFHLGDEGKENFSQGTSATTQIPGTNTAARMSSTDSPPEDADEIFKKMKETGLIPNAVAMLDGLCKDGLVQEAMKLFGLMREKGTIPEVVIYTAVVEGFCKAQKLEDAKRIFRKMQNNGISPNAFSYTVLIQGLCKGKRLEDAIEFSVEMLEAGHSPNLVTFVSLVDGFCTESGVEAAENAMGRLRERGFFVNEKAVREHLDKKGPFSSLVWEAIFGKKTSKRSF